MRNDSFDILGYDYDEDKIAVAQHSYLKRDGIEFQVADIVNLIPEAADAIIIADTLHYLPQEEQIRVLNQCREGLNQGGIIFVRDGLIDEKEKHKWTKKSEQWSTKYVRFNKTKGDLHFFNKAFIEDWAHQHNFKFELEVQSSKSSNVLMILTNTSG